MITVLFTCARCGLTDQEVSVRARDKNEDLIKWMELVSREVGRVHTWNSPRCLARTMTNLKVPLPNDDINDAWVGMQTSNVPPKGDPTDVQRADPS